MGEPLMLHESLRELVEVRGPAVVGEAEELRSALDDFLAEDEASLGEINLLVDAVRLGALRRALDVIDHGGEPEAAIQDAGIGLSRDRGTDDPIRSCWAVAALCFALGKVDDGMVRMFRSRAGTVPSGPPTAPQGRAPEKVAPTPPAPSPVPAAARRPTVPVDVPAGGGTLPRSEEPPVAVPSAVVPSVAPARRSSRAGVALLVVLVALILGGLVAAGVILLRAEDGEDAASDDATSAPRDRGRPEPLLPASAMLVPYQVGDDAAIFEVDVAEGTTRQVSPDGVDARLPSISPDRRSMAYVDFTDAEPGKPGVLMLMDLASGEVREVFTDTDTCALAFRAGWSLDGSRLAAICAAADGVPIGIYVTASDGSGRPRLVVEDSLVRGSPTWVSEHEIVYGRYGGDEEAPLGLRLVDVDEGGLPVDVPTPPGVEISHADWSPDAGKLLFLVSTPGGEQEVGSIWTMNANGTGQKLLAEGDFLHPVWSVDGEAIGITWYDDTGTEVLAYLRLDDPTSVVVVPDPPAGEVGIPAWGTR